jgi:hypothetical protein
MARERPELWHDQEKYALNAVVGCFSGLDVAVFTAGATTTSWNAANGRRLSWRAGPRERRNSPLHELRR